jgi:DNA-binding FadR family transcriptional regulator
MEFVSVKSRSLVEEVAEQLAAYVRQLETGDQKKLPSERKLAEQFGVARGVVREAIKRLEMQGLLEVRQGSGVRAVQRLHEPLSTSLRFLIPDLEERLRQLTDARIAIEPAVAEAAARNAKRADLVELWRLQEAFEQAPDLQTAVQIDCAFHRALAAISGNEVFKLMLESTAELRRESKTRTIGKVGKKVAVRHHRSIIEAIADKDPKAAAEAMRKHLVAAKRDLAKQNGAKK